VLFSNGIEVDTPKNVMRELGQLNWISNPERWIDYIDKRNETSHMYNEDVAIRIFDVIEKFISDAESLIIILDKNKR
jgi:nucleotidyltransferase substrate binding protein (TIGR01987 family)